LHRSWGQSEAYRVGRTTRALYHSRRQSLSY
jgi:hypothetical protein